MTINMSGKVCSSNLTKLTNNTEGKNYLSILLNKLHGKKIFKMKVMDCKSDLSGVLCIGLCICLHIYLCLSGKVLFG